VTENNRTISVTITRDCMNGSPAEEIDDTDDSCNQLVGKQIVQAVFSERLGSEKSDSTFTIA
jgi:hypothetical protein